MINAEDKKLKDMKKIEEVKEEVVEIIPEVKEAWARRERYQLSDLNENLWERSFETQLRIVDNSVSEPYCIWLSNEEREPKKLLFYGQCLDKQSQKAFDSFKRAELFQKLGDGYPQTSPFALAHALASLSRGNIKQRK